MFCKKNEEIYEKNCVILCYIKKTAYICIRNQKGNGNGCQMVT